MDSGTLFQLRNLINRRNIRKDPSSDVNASDDFFRTVTEGHIVSAAMEVFDMTSMDSTPSTTFFPKDMLKKSTNERQQILTSAVQKVVSKYVDLSYHTQEDNSAGEEVASDSVQEYAREVLSLGLLYFEFCDAIQEGDGSRILRCWRYLLLIFRAARRTNYAIEAFTLLAHTEFILSPRMASQLKWSRTVNTHGRPGKNIPCDLHMEHLNKECKLALSGLGSNITDQSVQRVGKCIGRTIPILQHFDEVNAISHQSGYHTRRSAASDTEKIVKQLSETSRVFRSTTGRTHMNFRNFHRNSMQKVSFRSLQQWMNEQFQKIVMYKY